jgi:two-component system, OmpR family, phosphate regulon sensor histidine kinase PhoR
MIYVIIVLLVILYLSAWIWWEDHGHLSARVTALRKDREQIREEQVEEQRYKQLFQSMLDELNQAVIIVTPAHRVSYMNRRMLHFFPHIADLAVNPALNECIQSAELDQLVEQVLGDGKPHGLQVTLQAGEGRSFYVEATPMPPGFGGGIWLAIADITERLQVEQIRRDFVTNASHELRTPLTLVRGYIESLQDGVITDKTALQRSLVVMDKHTQRLQRLVEDMLTISRLESPEPRLDCAWFCVEECVKEVLEQLSPLIEQKRVEVTLQFPAQGGQLMADRFYWDQIFINLIENALKENKSAGLRLRVCGEWLVSEAVFTVEDNGVGIPSADQPFVFKRFYRGQRHQARSETKGTGLGLSIVKRAVEAHGGSIELVSEPQVRTAFIMRVPLV